MYCVYDVCVDAMSSLEKGEDGTSSLKLLGCLRVVLSPTRKLTPAFSQMLFTCSASFAW